MLVVEALSADDFTEIYREIAEIIGVEATLKLHERFQGQQITLPKKLYTRDYIIAQVKKTAGSSDIKRVASKFGYTERRLRQLLKESG